ncbi:Uma2 family endonuclease [bacterium]|nr:Uma2 family endonuclease [bacterium]
MLNVQDEKFWTYADYCKLPEDGKRYEVIDGVLYMSPSPKSIHQALSKYLEFLLFGLEQAGHGWVFNAPFDVIMPGATPVQPDLIFVGAHQRQIMGPDNIQGVPMLLVEILSPGSGRLDRVTKLNKYAQCGVPHYWILDPKARTLEVLKLEGDSYRLLSALESGTTFVHPDLFHLKLDVAELFAQVPAEIDSPGEDEK